MSDRKCGGWNTNHGSRFCQCDEGFFGIGKAPGIVMPDADLDLAVKSIIASRVINTGQVCNCCERVYVHSSIKEAFLEKLLAGFKQVKVGIRISIQTSIWVR